MQVQDSQQNYYKCECGEIYSGVTANTWFYGHQSAIRTDGIVQQGIIKVYGFMNKDLIDIFVKVLLWEQT